MELLYGKDKLLRELLDENARLKIKCRLFDHVRESVKQYGYSSVTDAVNKAEARAARIDEMRIELNYAEAQVDKLKIRTGHLEGQIEHYRDLVHERVS